MNSEKMFYRAKELAVFLGVGESTVWWRAKNEPNFPKPFKQGENTTVWNIQEVMEYMELQRLKDQ